MPRTKKIDGPHASLPPKRAATPGERCARCARLLKTGRDFPLLGLIGPECEQHVSALGTALVQLDGAACREGDPQSVQVLGRAVRALISLGLAYTVEDRTEHGEAVKVLHVTGPRWKAKPVITTWEQRRAEFEQTLRDAGALPHPKPAETALEAA